MDWKTLIEIKWYLQSIKPLFIEGNIKLISEDWKIKISYKDSFLDFDIKERLPLWDKEAESKVIEFCFDSYFYFEWKGEALNSEIIWKLLKLRPWSVRAILSKIYNKLEIYGKPILQEKQEITNIQDNQQRATRSMIQEESSARDSWEKESRTQKALWEN